LPSPKKSDKTIVAKPRVNGSLSDKTSIPKKDIHKSEKLQKAAKKVRATPTKGTDAKKKAVKKTASKKAIPPTKTIEFKLRFHTEYGQSLYITGNHELFGNSDLDMAVPLKYHDPGTWVLRTELADLNADINYHYLLKNEDGSYEIDWGNRSFKAADFTSIDIVIIDSWNHAGYFENVFYTIPFKDVLLPKISYNNKKAITKDFTHRLKIKAPLLRNGEILCVLGTIQELSHWDTEKPITLSKKEEDDFWAIDLDITRLQHGTEYKY
jgi:4-alpha-glucanotransferase